MPLRLNWFPWMEMKIWWSIKSWTARLQVSLFLLSWRLNCHLLPEKEATSPSVLLFSFDLGWAAELLEDGLAKDIETWRESETPACCPSSAISSAESFTGSSGKKASVKLILYSFFFLTYLLALYQEIESTADRKVGDSIPVSYTLNPKLCMMAVQAVCEWCVIEKVQHIDALNANVYLIV